MAEKFKELFRDYREGRITRRQFMRKTVAITGSLVAANRLLEQLTDLNTHAAEVDVSDPTVLSHEVDFPGKAGVVFGYLARPAAKGQFPAITIIHANQGLNDYIREWRVGWPSEVMSASLSIFSPATAARKKLIQKAKG